MESNQIKNVPKVKLVNLFWTVYYYCIIGRTFAEECPLHIWSQLPSLNLFGENVVMHSLLVISLLSWILCIHFYKSAEILFVLYGWTKAVRGISTAQLCKLSRFRFPNTSKLHWAMCCFPVVLLLLTYKGFSGPDFFRGWVMGQGHPLIPST